MTSREVTTATRDPLVSIIVPTLDEADSLGETLAAISSNDVPFEIFVIDAGSSDRTAEIALNAGATVIHSVRRQRAFQLNLGARHARAAALLFLHADTVLPEGALESIINALQDRRFAGGAFSRRYASPSITLRLTCQLARFRNLLIGWHLGDQAMFVRRASFFQLGGFHEVERFEDLDFSRRLRRFGRTVTLRACVTSSSRRFDQSGPLGRTLHDFLLTVRYVLCGLNHSQPSTSSPPALAYERVERLRTL